MSAPGPLAGNLPEPFRVERNTPALFWVTHAHPRKLNPPWVESDTHHSEGYYCQPPHKPISRCIPPRG